MLERQIAAEEQRLGEKQVTMSKGVFELEWQVSEVEGTKSDVELAYLVYAREKERLEGDSTRLKTASSHEKNQLIEEVHGLKDNRVVARPPVRMSYLVFQTWIQIKNILR